MQMKDYPTETLAMRFARLLASALPVGRASLVRAAATILRQPREFFARCNSLTVLVDVDDFVSCTLYNYGTFEPAVAAVFNSIVRAGDTVLDVGANFGVFTLLVANRQRQMGGGGKIISFEPDPRNLARLDANLRANSFSNVTVIRKGLFDRATTKVLYLSDPRRKNQGTSSLLSHIPGQPELEIELTTLDSFLAEAEIPLVNFMKMDIEGAELAALSGGREALAAGKIRWLLIELHIEILGVDNSKEVLKILLSFGYEVWFLDETTGAAASPMVLRPLTERSDLATLPPCPHLLCTLDRLPRAFGAILA